MKTKNFETADLYLTSAISLILKAPPNFRVENGKTLFVFPISEELWKAMNAYNSGVELNVLEYSQTLKQLRGEMITRRKMG